MWGVGVAQGTGLFDGLDVELLVEILRHTGLKQRVHCAMVVCKAWRLLTSHQELFTNLENKAGGRTMKLLAREAPGAKKPVEIKGKREVKKDMKSLKELAKEGAPVQKYDAGRAPVEESINDKDRKATTRKNNRELSRQLTGK